MQGRSVFRFRNRSWFLKSYYEPMLRRIGFSSLLIAAFAAACGTSSDDSTTTDASTDQTTTSDAPKESSSSDVTPPPDASPDVAPDVSQDVAQDVALDVSVDAPLDVASDALSDAPQDVGFDVNFDAGGCLTNSDCSNADYCERGNGVCVGVGVCTARPQNCFQLVSYVCGCDNKSYINSCYAHQGGATVAYTGMCE